MTEHEQTLADNKMRAEIAKLVAETNRVRVSTVLAPALAGAAFAGAIGAIVKLLF